MVRWWRNSIGGSLTYIHKVKDGRILYFFGNSSDKRVDTKVTLRGNLNLAIWGPMDGSVRLRSRAQARDWVSWRTQQKRVDMRCLLLGFHS